MSRRYYCMVDGCTFETNKPKMARDHDETSHPERGLTTVDEWAEQRDAEVTA